MGEIQPWDVNTIALTANVTPAEGHAEGRSPSILQHSRRTCKCCKPSDVPQTLIIALHQFSSTARTPGLHLPTQSPVLPTLWMGLNNLWIITEKDGNLDNFLQHKQPSSLGKKSKFALYLTPKESYHISMQTDPKEWEGKLH